MKKSDFKTEMYKKHIVKSDFKTDLYLEKSILSQLKTETKMKKLLILPLIFMLFLGCDSDLTESPQLFKQLNSFTTLTAQKGEDTLNFSLILDQGGNQLYFYDINEDCYLDFENSLPGKNGLILPSNPKKLEISTDNRKIITLSNDNVITLINVDPLIDYYQKECKQQTFPYIEAQTKVDITPDFFRFSKTIDTLYNLELVSFKGKNITQYIYSEMTFAPMETVSFPNEITSVFSKDEKLFIAQKGVSYISIFEGGVLQSENIAFGELPESIDISKFLIDNGYIFIYQKDSTALYIWNINESKYEIINEIDPLNNQNDLFMDKRVSFEYPIYDMITINHSIDLKEGEFLNTTGYLNTHQLPDGKYLVVSDTSGYIRFFTISVDLSKITSKPDSYETIESYKSALELRFRKFKQPLQADYSAKVTYLTQQTLCTQFNKREANGCFSQIQTEVTYEAEQYIKLSESLNNGTYSLKDESFFFKYQGAIDNSLSNDGSFLDSSTIQSTTVDFEKFDLDASKVFLDILSPLTDEKIADSKCAKYANTESLFIPINSLSNHTLSLNIDGHENLSYCFDTAITFQLRANNHFTLYGSKTKFIGVVPFCTNEPSVYSDRVSCETDVAIYENSLFSVKLFSDKEEIETDSTISFFLGVSSEPYRYRHSMIAPIELKTVIRKIDDINETTLLTLDNSRNRVIEIKLTELNSIETILQ